MLIDVKIKDVTDILKEKIKGQVFYNLDNYFCEFKILTSRVYTIRTTTLEMLSLPTLVYVNKIMDELKSKVIKDNFNV